MKRWRRIVLWLLNAAGWALLAALLVYASIEALPVFVRALLAPIPYPYPY